MFEMLGMIKQIVLLFGLFFNAWNDEKKQEIHLLLTIIMGMCGCVFHILLFDIGSIEFFLGGLLGVGLLFLGYVTKEQIGYGDGCIFIMTGFFLGIWKNMQLLLVAFLLAGIYAVTILFFKRKCRYDRIPFVPFVLVAYVLSL